METYRGDWNVENRVTAESEFPLRVAFVTKEIFLSSSSQ